MANKITIDELVTKYTFEIDPKGAKSYEDLLDKVGKKGQAAAVGETRARKKAATAQERIADGSRKRLESIVDKGLKTNERAAKRSSRAQERSAKRTTKAVAREAKKATVAREVMAAAALKNDSVAFAAGAAAMRRAQAAQTAAVRRGTTARQRLVRRAARRTRRSEATAQKRVRRDIRKTERVQRKSARQAGRASRTEAKRTGRATRTEARKSASVLRRLNKRLANSKRIQNAKKFALAIAGIGKAAAVAGAAVAVAAGAVAAFVISQTAALDTIAKVSKQTGLGAEEYQRLAFAAERSGTSISGIGTASKKLEIQMQDAAAGGGKLFLEALSQIGLSADEIKGKSFEQQLGIISDAMNQTSTATEKVGISAKLFGLRAGPDLIPLLNEGAEGIRKLGAEAGNVFSADELAPAEAFQDRLADLKLELSQVAGRLALELVPVVEKTVNGFREWVKANEPLIREQAPKILAFFSAVSSAAAFVVNGLLSIAGATGDATVALETLTAAVIATKLAMAGPAGLVTAAALTGAAIGNLLNAFGASDNLEQFLADVTGLNAELGQLRRDAGGVAKRGQGSKLAGGDVKTESRQEFTKDGKKFSISEKNLLAVALGEKKSDTLTAREAQRIVTQVDKQRDPDRIARGERQGKANAAKGEREHKKNKKKGKGKTAAKTGLEAQIDKQITEISDRAELRESARALREGFDSDTAFQFGKDAAKATEGRLRDKFESTGELPVGIARDVQQLSRSPAVEEAIGRVPPPVISVENNVNNITISGNEFKTELETTLTGANMQEFNQQSAKAVMKIVGQEIGAAVRNTTPKELV